MVFEHSRLADLAAALPTAPPAAGGSTVVPRSPDAKPVLSFDQQRVWLECMVKGGTAYNVHGRQWLNGPLDAPVLERSIRAVINRHEALRTSFPAVGGLPEPHVAPPDLDWRLTVRDLSGLGPGEAERLADGQAETVFDLAAGPLFDCLLVRVSDTRHLLSMTIHHIVSDAWSVGLILRELSALYRADGETGRAGLPELPVQYLDYAVWQRAEMAGERLTEQVGFWRRQLAGAPSALALPTARRRLPAQGSAGGRVRMTLAQEASAALHKLCRAHEVTPFMAMLAAYATVLRRWSGQDDLVIGVPVNTRGAAGADALVGLFVNTLPLRLRLTGDPSFHEVLERVRQTSVEGYGGHADTPFEALVSKVRPVRDPARTPVFQVMLNMIGSAEREWRLPGITVETPQHPVQPSKFDLNLDVHHSDGGYRFDLQYHAERYDEAAMRALLGQLGSVLKAATDDPNRSIAELALHDGPEPHSPLEREPEPARPDRTAFLPGLAAADRFAPLSAGAAVWQSAMAVEGAALVLPDRPLGDDPDALLAWLRTSAVTAVELSPPLLRALTGRGAQVVLPLLRHALLDNDGTLTAHDVAQVRQLAPGCRVVAVFLPAADSPPVTGFEVPANWTPASAPLRVPIGPPAAMEPRDAAGRRPWARWHGCSPRAGPPLIWCVAAPTGCWSSPAPRLEALRTPWRPWRPCWICPGWAMRWSPRPPPPRARPRRPPGWPCPTGRSTRPGCASTW
jgi:hypothetical protein